jgi:predicted dehydrogenase
MTACLESGAGGYDAQQARGGGGGFKIAPPAVNTYRAEIEEFSQAILAGREPANSAALGLQSQRVLAACYESARTGRVISLEPTSP